MERLINDILNYIDEAIRCAMMDPAATLLVFMLLLLVIITPGRKAVVKLLMALVICYIYLILTSNVLSRSEFSEMKYSFELFSSYRREMVENILLFVPLGMLMCGLDLKTRPVKPWKNEKAYRAVRFVISMTFAIIFICIIECLQLFLQVGVFTLDDILCNTTGALLGYGFILLVVFIAGKVNSCKTKPESVNS